MAPGKWHLVDDETMQLMSTRAFGSQVELDRQAIDVTLPGRRN